jgi:predicted nucleic acid-binding protein
MGIFIDTSGFIATRNKKDKNHVKAIETMRHILQNEHGAIYTSDYVFNEAVSVALARTKQIDFAIDVGHFILDSKKIVKLFTSEEDFRMAWGIFEKYQEKQWSFTDATIVHHAQRHNVGLIFSYDTHFDGLLKRIG